MKKSLSFITLLLFTFLAITFFIPKSVFADGMMMKPDPYSGRWDYSNESNQQAFINYDNGLQKMIISVGLEGENSEGVVWLFPIPADPNKVTIDVVKSLPQLSGEEISKKAKSNLDDTTEFLQRTQLYTIPFISFYEVLVTTGRVTQGLGRNVEQNVIVYEHLDKEGISSEIITAKTANGLYDYLKSKGLKIESGSIPVLDNYIGKEYSFVASWISSPSQAIVYEYETITNKVLKTNEELLSDAPQDAVNMLINGVEKGLPGIREYFQKNPRDVKGYVDSHPYAYSIVVEYLQKNRPDLAYKEITEQRLKPKPVQTNNNQKGVFVTFPTKDIYFPLLPTSVYGSKTVPATIRIIGHVSPKVFQDIKSYTKTEYYVDNHASFTDDLKNFYSGQNQNIKYTKIEINAPSKFLTDDLWINNRAPVKTYYSTFVAKHPMVSAIILFILSSILAGMLAGLIIFRDLRKKPVKLGFIGLSNFLTLLGLLITIVLVGTKNKNESVEPLLAEIKQKGYFWKRRVATILFFVAIPFLAFGLFALPSFIRKISDLRHSMSDFVISILIIYVLPISSLIISLIIKRVKIEDRNLFEQLKLAGYSSWLFQPKDKMKYIFVPVFSISFLIISWLLVKLVGFTV
ncbi:MAG: hypothetical protein COT39_04230 [Parcubacteria group bacterium CG08_land_8_20_14_0_20_48_21]|nr:MAG: hypothetical protein AUK21_00855 [Parcubacteria group bacterium CG2_30_48_51]PIS32522.1 MAG: hypothetical protein COT39_04230 [Parcubacteria group bacterium CG08_land_8_20_14_0_20_48_21]PIW79519.1 MAG: hypothetical protein COZ99_00510 [Parcubacteria group bacterium CG_4_8_14_3_um_filter_48_16]PIY78107.1 MAG: hypothetical protein COY83_01750 [Parcubacteria group bacterium CG_4_10_14_0_8_um_filter_48_154]PIZ77674.1 MAG: hypothetical protein COY03_02130 [bacterium CG_4_10_14_0_2_um_filter_